MTSKRFACPRQANGDVARGRALDRSDFRGAQSFQVKGHCLAIRFVELAHSRRESRAEVLASRCRCRVWSRIGDFVAQWLGLRPALTRSEGERAIVCHAIDKRSLRALTSKARQRLPEREPDLLQQVILIGPLRQVGAHEAPDRRGILSDDRIEGQTACVLQGTGSGSEIVQRR